MHKLIASCAVPGLYSSVKIGDHLYADGGVMDNYPIEPFANDKLPILGSFVRLPVDIDSDDLSSTRKVLKRSVFIQRYAIEIPKFDQTYLSILHDLNDYSAFKQKDAMGIYNQVRSELFG